jgi:hypothetical protein
MKKRNLLLVILAVLLVFGMVIGCGDLPDDGTGTGTGTGTGDVAVTLNSVTQDGTATKPTSQLTLTFNKAITGLTADNITLSGVAGVTKGTLGGSGTSYTLPISGFSAGGTLSVAVAAPTGYKMSGSPKTVAISSASDLAKIYFGEYLTTYMLSGATTNESVTINTTGNTLTIEEKANNESIDKLVFAINSWEVVTTGVPNDVVDPSAEVDLTEFKIGFKVKGKISSSTGGYLPSNKTTPGFVAADAGASTTTESWLYIWVGTYQYGKKLVRSPFSKSSVAGATGNNEATNFVTGSTGTIRVYKMEEDD